jgi:hypothetical protein
MTTREDNEAEALREVYLGDGLYCRFDGYQFVLRAPREHGDDFVALEPPVLKKFEAHVKRIHVLQANSAA